jgi:hypothetical protein
MKNENNIFVFFNGLVGEPVHSGGNVYRVISLIVQEEAEPAGNRD